MNRFYKVFGGGGRMRTEQVEYFLEVVKAGSFTKAAENLHIQQPSIRESIINLEQELGGALFNRSKKGVELNDYGRYCLPYFQLIHESYGKMKYKDELQETTSLLIDVQSNFDTFLTSFYRSVKPQLRGTELKINTNNDLDVIANSLMQNKIDLAFVCISADENNNTFFQTICEHGLSSSELCNFETMVLMRDTHPLVTKKDISIHELCEYPIILNAYSAPAATFLKKINCAAANMIKIGSWKMVEDYLKSTDALTITAKNKNYNENFVARPIKYGPVMVMQALYKKGNMNEQILRCINVMKLTISNFF